MKGEMRPSQPPTPPVGPPTEPTRPPCAINLSNMLGSEVDPPNTEQLNSLRDQAIIQTGSICLKCLENPSLGLVLPGDCPAKDQDTASSVVIRLRKGGNRAFRRRVQHVLINTKETIYIPGLDDEARDVISGERTTSREDPEIEEEDGIASPQGLPDLRRGVEPEILRDLGY